MFTPWVRAEKREKKSALMICNIPQTGSIAETSRNVRLWISPPAYKENSRDMGSTCTKYLSQGRRFSHKLFFWKFSPRLFIISSPLKIQNFNIRLILNDRNMLGCKVKHNNMYYKQLLCCLNGCWYVGINLNFSI
jgi:hypothetical protein